MNHFRKSFWSYLEVKKNVLYLMVFLSFFANFWMTKLKLLSGKPRQSVENYSNPNLVIGSFLEIGFEATLRWKTIFLNVWKWYFSLFWNFLSNEVESVFWESEAKRSKLFQSKFRHRNFLRKWFRRILELKNEFFAIWKGHFSVFCRFFSDEIETIFWESEARHS